MTRRATFAAALLLLAPGLQAGPNKAARAAKIVPDAALAEESRKAILQTGLSAEFFKSHFKLVRVVNDGAIRSFKTLGSDGLVAKKAGSAWVEWRFSFGGYEAAVRDPVSYVLQTSYPRSLHTSHGIKAALGRTHDLGGTLPLATVKTILKDCLGDYEEAGTAYRASGPEEEARLRWRGQNKAGAVGFVDLETGECRLERTGQEQAGAY